MTHICHLLDGSAGWEQRISLSQLLERLPADSFPATMATVDPSVANRLGLSNRRIEVLARLGAGPVQAAPTTGRFLFEALAAPVAARFFAKRKIDLVHAWGVEAAWAARGTDRPLVVELFDPIIAARQIKRVRALSRPKGFAVACNCETVRRRLVEGGIKPQQCVVIRPGVDFSLINECRQGSAREQLGLARDEFVVVVPEPVEPASGPADVFWAVVLLSHSLGGIRLILPGASIHKQRIVRCAATVPRESPLIFPAPRFPFERLLAICDALVVAPRGDLSTTSIAWALGAGVAVIGTAVPSVAELVTNKVNGVLFRQTAGKSMVLSIVKALRDRASQEKAKDVARGQAYRVFGVRRCVDQHLRLYENLLSGTGPGEGIADSTITM